MNKKIDWIINSSWDLKKTRDVKINIDPKPIELLESKYKHLTDNSSIYRSIASDEIGNQWG